MADAAAITTSATLRSLTSIGAVVSGSGSGMRRSSSCTRLGIWFLRRDHQAGATLQRLVDGDRRLRALGGRDDDELHVSRRVADDEEAWNVGLAEIVGPYRAAAIHFATKTGGNVALLALVAREKYGVTADRRAVGKGDRAHHRPVVFHARDCGCVNRDPLFLEPAAVVAADALRAVGAERHARRPGFQREREAGARRAGSNDRNRPVAMLPAVAVRAVMNGDAVAVIEAGNVRDVVAYASRDERHARTDFFAVVEGRLEHVVEVNEVG